AKAYSLRAEQHVFATLSVHHADHNECLAPQVEWLKVAECERVLVVASYWFATSGMDFALGIQGTNTTLPADSHVDQSCSNSAAMVKAELEFDESMAGRIQQSAFDIVAGTQVSQPEIERTFAQGITVYYPLGVELMAFAFSVAGEAETDRLIAGAIVALT